MSKDTSELILIKKSINLCCQPIFSYISSLVIARNIPFSQSLSHISSHYDPCIRYLNHCCYYFCKCEYIILIASYHGSTACC